MPTLAFLAYLASVITLLVVLPGLLCHHFYTCHGGKVANSSRLFLFAAGVVFLFDLWLITSITLLLYREVLGYPQVHLPVSQPVAPVPTWRM